MRLENQLRREKLLGGGREGDLGLGLNRSGGDFVISGAGERKEEGEGKGETARSSDVTEAVSDQLPWLESPFPMQLVPEEEKEEEPPTR